MTKLFASLPLVLGADGPERFIAEAARFLGELNAIHPFREGNGRSQLAFMAMVGETASFALDFARVRRDSFMPAMIASYAGDLEPLSAELRALLR
jgi:cell filamentation protein